MLAVAEEREEGTEGALEMQLRGVATNGVNSGKFKPRCALCGAPYDTFEVEVARTKFATLEEALPKLRESEAAQRVLSELCESMGVTYDELKALALKAKGAVNN
jgi:hypothetical protein